MAKRKTFKTFFRWKPEEQASYIEKETAKLIKRLPTLKKKLQMYGEMSDELYNLTPSEVKDIGTTYVSAVRGGEISTPSSKQAYQRFIRQMRKYTRTPIKKLAIETAEERLASWLDNVRANGSEEEIAYAEELINQMTDEQKIGFTLSKYFLDVENWNSLDFRKETDEGTYSIQVLKLELYLQSCGVDTRNIYNTKVASDGQTDAIRPATRGGRPRRR